jgi:hypothetical protein
MALLPGLLAVSTAYGMMTALTPEKTRKQNRKKEETKESQSFTMTTRFYSFSTYSPHFYYFIFDIMVSSRISVTPL